MDVTLGPWTASHAEHKPIAEAMGDEAWKTVENKAGFTPKKWPTGKNPTVKGYSISGNVTGVVKQGRSSQVLSKFTILVDGTMSNVPPIDGTGYAEGSNTPEDAMRAIAEARITKILETLKGGRVKKAR
jgi:hypothetical protein